MITIHLTDDSELRTDGGKADNPMAAIEYLNASPRHAVVLEHTSGRKSYVLRGAGEDLNNFYYGAMPAEDPNDACGGDMTAGEALVGAMLMITLTGEEGGAGVRTLDGFRVMADHGYWTSIKHIVKDCPIRDLHDTLRQAQEDGNYTPKPGKLSRQQLEDEVIALLERRGTWRCE